MTLAEMLDVVEDRQSFERILQTLDVPAYAISNATCYGRIERRKPLAADDLRFLQRHTNKPVKVTLPGPYLLTRAMYVPSVTSAAYASKEELGEDVVRVLREEVEELIAGGAAFIHFDEPVLTELVFTQGLTRTFMCAALAARRDPTEELELAVSLNNRVLEGISGVRTGLHVCRGNWSRDESTLLRGSYQPLRPYLERINVQQLVLEYATERAGEVLRFENVELGLGAVNPRSADIEPVEKVARLVEEALQTYLPEQIFLNPDCGFATFSNRPVNGGDEAYKKLKTLVSAAREFRTCPTRGG
jgi:5-methyltetrahydropteroyltriglutamate--homocysteine methyltransferase